MPTPADTPTPFAPRVSSAPPSTTPQATTSARSRTSCSKRPSNDIMFAVIGFGGFLGIGEKFHAIPWSVLDYDPERGGYVVPFTKEQLKAAPAHDIDELTGTTARRARRLVQILQRRSLLALTPRSGACWRTAARRTLRAVSVSAHRSGQRAAFDLRGSGEHRPAMPEKLRDMPRMTDFPIFDLSRFEQAGPAAARGTRRRGRRHLPHDRLPGDHRAIPCRRTTIDAAWNAARAFFDLAARGEERGAGALCRLSLWLSRPRRRGARQVARAPTRRPTSRKVSMAARSRCRPG